jgi:hypothetical protein
MARSLANADVFHAVADANGPHVLDVMKGEAPVGCAYRKSSPSILVMQSTQDRTAPNAPRCLGST